MSKRAPASLLVVGLVALSACTAGSSSGTAGSSAGSRSAPSTTRTHPAKSATSTTPTNPAKSTSGGGTTSSGVGIHKIKHVIIIMQENRSFDSYFGTFPGADGIPRAGGDFTVCLPDPRSGGCQKPYHDPAQVNGGGQHNDDVATEDIDGGRMDGFVRMAEAPGGRGCGGAAFVCSSSAPSDVMGYHDARDIPNYWRWAHDFTLQDRMFESNASWSLPAHLFLVSGWSARCTREADPASCVNDDELSGFHTGDITGSGPARDH